MKTMGVALIGYKFMGKAHSLGYREATALFEPKIRPEMRVICGRNEAAVRDAARSYGWAEYATDWQKVVARDDIQIVDIATPGDSHAQIAMAAARSGKHILCEKPLANSLAESGEMRRAVEASRVTNMVCFNYRRVPAITLARELIEAGEIGRVYHWRATWLSDFGSDPEFPLIWRFQREKAGSGPLSDLGAHLVDLASYLVGPVKEVVGLTETFVKERPLLPEDRRPGRSTGPVTVDDGALFLTRFENGAIGSFEATRFATGNRQWFRFEVNGSDGALRFDLERMNELEFYSRRDRVQTQGYRTIFVSETVHPYVANWWWSGLSLGYDATFVHTIYEFMNAIAEGKPAEPDFRQGVRAQAVIEAVNRSVEKKSWVKISDLLSEMKIE